MRTTWGSFGSAGSTRSCSLGTKWHSSLICLLGSHKIDGDQLAKSSAQRFADSNDVPIQSGADGFLSVGWWRRENWRTPVLPLVLESGYRPTLNELIEKRPGTQIRKIVRSRARTWVKTNQVQRYCLTLHSVSPSFCGDALSYLFSNAVLLSN